MPREMILSRFMFFSSGHVYAHYLNASIGLQRSGGKIKQTSLLIGVGGEPNLRSLRLSAPAFNYSNLGSGT